MERDEFFSLVGKAVILSEDRISAFCIRLNRKPENKLVSREDINYLCEEMPSLIWFVTSGLNTTVTQLKMDIANGKITYKHLVDAIINQKESINKVFKRRVK